MPDNFERAKDDILYRTDKNGGPTQRDLLVAMGALAQDVDEGITTIADKFEEHCITSRDEISDLQIWRAHVETECYQQVTAKLTEEHQKIHDEHVREMHKLGLMTVEGEEDSRRVWFMWLIGGKLAYVFLAIAIFLIQMLSSWVWHVLID